MVHIFLHQSRVGLARRGIVLGEMRVDEHVVKLNAFAAKRAEDKVVDRPEGILGKTVGTQTVLIADHHELVVGMLTQEGKAGDGTRYELQFLERVNLLVLRLADDGAVAVNEQYLFHILLSLWNRKYSSCVPVLSGRRRS